MYVTGAGWEVAVFSGQAERLDSEYTWEAIIRCFPDRLSLVVFRWAFLVLQGHRSLRARQAERGRK